MAEQVIDIELSRLHPDEKNPRRKAVVSAEMVSSIKESGIIEPLIVRPNGDGFIIISGHRRHVNAKEAKLTTAPCIVRDLSEQDVAITQLAENIQREELDPVEEASGIFRLMETGMKAKDLAAKIGRPAKFVTDRIKLLDLPVKVLALVKKGDVTIANALAVHKYVGKRTDAQLVDAVQSNNPDWVLERSARHEKQAAKAKSESDQAEKLGARKLAMNGYSLPTGTKKLKDYDLKPTECKGQPWLCFVVEDEDSDWRVPTLIWLTDDPAATKAFKKEKDPDFGKLSDKQIAERAKNKEIRESDAARMEALQATLKKTVKATELVEFLAVELASFLRFDRPALLCRIAGIEPPNGQKWSKVAYEWQKEAKKLAKADPTRFARAYRLMALEDEFAKHYPSYAEPPAKKALAEALGDSYDLSKDARVTHAKGRV